jgi:uncharacterized protein with GYD domain
MAHYLLQVAYTSEAWANMLKNPQDRIEIVTKAVQNLGGSVVGGWLSFGEFKGGPHDPIPDCRYHR